MASTDIQNCLKFSRNNDSFNRSIGILNQNPIIVTKKEAFNFNYADTNKLRLAQLLARRDIKAIKEIEANKIQEELSQRTTDFENLNTPVNVNEKLNPKICKSLTKPKPIRERVSSVKRVPGPQTPNRIKINRCVPVKNLPIRSTSPPTKDTDEVWRPQNNNDVFSTKESEMEKLCRKVELCTSKLDGLERQIKAKSQNTEHSIMSAPFFNIDKSKKSNKELNILSDKLQQLLNTNIQSPRNTDFVTVNAHQPVSIAQSPNTNNINIVLSRLGNLVSEIDTIQSRWRYVNYETVSVCSDDQHMLDEDMRFTKTQKMNWTDEITMLEDLDRGKLELNVPRSLVSHLDKTRSSAMEMFQFHGLPLKLTHIDWLTEDFVNELVEDVVGEMDDLNNQLVEAILHEELIE